MKRLITLFLSFFLTLSASGQGKRIDTLRLALEKATDADTTRLNALKALSHYYLDLRPDSGLMFCQEGYEVSLKLNRFKDQAYFLRQMGNTYTNLGDYARGVSVYYKAIKISHNIDDIIGEAALYNNISVAYEKKKDYRKALSFSQYGLKLYNSYTTIHHLSSYRDKIIGVLLYLNLGEEYIRINRLDSANYYTQLSYAAWKKNHLKTSVLGPILYDLGELEKSKGNKEAALKYFRKTIKLTTENADLDNLSNTYRSVADLYHKFKQQDSSEYYCLKALQIGMEHKLWQDVLDASQALYIYFEQDHNLPMAYKYLKLAMATNDSLFNQDKVKQLLDVDFDEQLKQRDIENASEKERNNMRVYLLILGFVAVLLLTFLFWRDNRQRAKTNHKLRQQQRQLDLINQNLELIVYERTKDLIDKNDKLNKYSYYLSHQIRGPISTVKGLVHIKKEGLVSEDDFIQMIGVCVNDIDSKIMEISNMLNEPVK